jgi:hypothetical protein
MHTLKNRKGDMEEDVEKGWERREWERWKELGLKSSEA